MKLESEFRVWLQLQQLERELGEQINLPQSELSPSTWVKLLEAPSDFSDDEALLVCQISDHQWLAWIPDYGEILLDTDQFCRLH